MGKRLFDILLSFLGLGISGPIIILAYFLASLDTRRSGFFFQLRVGLYGRQFKVIKIRTMKEVAHVSTSVTTDRDPRITRLGRFFRKTKIDELPQLVNVLLGDMSFVGPRPDVPGFADRLKGDDRLILSVRPGITSPATLKFRNEEEILASQQDPEQYNRDVLFPEKTVLNREYVENYSFCGDIRLIFATIFPPQQEKNE